MKWKNHRLKGCQSTGIFHRLIWYVQLKNIAPTKWKKHWTKSCQYTILCPHLFASQTITCYKDNRCYATWNNRVLILTSTAILSVQTTLLQWQRLSQLRVSQRAIPAFNFSTMYFFFHFACSRCLDIYENEIGCVLFLLVLLELLRFPQIQISHLVA